MGLRTDVSDNLITLLQSLEITGDPAVGLWRGEVENFNEENEFPRVDVHLLSLTAGADEEVGASRTYEVSVLVALYVSTMDVPEIPAEDPEDVVPAVDGYYQALVIADDLEDLLQGVVVSSGTYGAELVLQGDEAAEPNLGRYLRRQTWRLVGLASN